MSQQLALIPEQSVIPPAEPATARGTRLPADWTPSPADIGFAMFEGFTEREAWRIADQFRDYWHAASGKNAVKRSWPATWRVWVRRDADERAKKRRKPTGVESAMRAAEAYFEGAE
jgi:hypothetical protein